MLPESREPLAQSPEAVAQPMPRVMESRRMRRRDLVESALVLGVRPRFLLIVLPGLPELPEFPGPDYRSLLGCLDIVR